MLDLLIEHPPEGICPRQVAEVLDKNYHTTRSLLRKMEAAGEIRHVNSHYVVIPGNISRNQCHQRNQRNQSIASALQPAGQIARCEEPCPSTIDYSDYVDYADYANVSVLSNVSQTLSIPPPLAGASLQPPPSAPGALLSQSGVMQDARDQQEVDVINCHQRNQRNHCMLRNAAERDLQLVLLKTSIDYTDYG